MENRTYALISVGFLIIAALVVVGLNFWLQQGKAEPQVYQLITRQSVGGLKVEAPVKFKGITIGHVKSFGFTPDDPTRIRIRIRTQRDAYITQATYAKLAFGGITGSKYIQLAQGDGKRASLATHKDSPARIPVRKGLLDKLAQSAKQNLHRVDQIMANLTKALDKSNRQHLTETLAQLDRSSQRLASIEKELMPVIAKMPGLMTQAKQTLQNSQQTIDELQRLASHAQGPVQKLPDVEDAIIAFSGSGQRLVRQASRDTLPGIDMLVSRLDRTARQVEALARQLKNNPQSILTGPSQAGPGPGEPGFNRQ